MALISPLVPCTDIVSDALNAVDSARTYLLYAMNKGL